MKIHNNENAGKISDLLFSVYYIYNDHYTDSFVELAINPNKQVEEALKQIKASVIIDYELVDLFFNMNTPVIENFCRLKDIWGMSLGDYIKSIKEMDAIEALIKLLGYISEKLDITKNEIELMIEDNQSIINFLNGLNISNSLKWETYSFILNPKAYLQKLSTFLEEYVIIYNDVMKNYKISMDTFNKQINTLASKNPKELLDTLLNGNYEMNTDNIYLTTTFVLSHHVLLNHNEDSLFVSAGINYEEAYKKLYGQDEIEHVLNIFKCLSDNTRLQVLMLIAQKPTYGQEIAEKIGISMATVTYHMNFLMGANIVKMNRDGHKIYYTLNKDTISTSVKFLENIFLT